jgi:hypothetical protein
MIAAVAEVMQESERPEPLRQERRRDSRSDFQPPMMRVGVINQLRLGSHSF